MESSALLREAIAASRATAGVEEAVVGSSFLRNAAWERLDQTFAEAVDGLFGTAVREARPPRMLASGTIISAIQLTSPEVGLGIGLAIVGLAQDGFRGLCKLLLGEDEVQTELVHDLLGEAANVVAGKLKVELEKTGCAFTIGLPSGKSWASLNEFVGLHEVRRAHYFAAPVAQFAILAGLQRGGRRAVPASALRENMVLAEDLLSDSGALLTRAGTRLSTSAAARLAALLLTRPVAVFTAGVDGG